MITFGTFSCYAFTVSPTHTVLVSTLMTIGQSYYLRQDAALGGSR